MAVRRGAGGPWTTATAAASAVDAADAAAARATAEATVSLWIAGAVRTASGAAPVASGAAEGSDASAGIARPTGTTAAAGHDDPVSRAKRPIPGADIGGTAAIAVGHRGPLTHVDLNLLTRAQMRQCRLGLAAFAAGKMGIGVVAVALGAERIDVQTVVSGRQLKYICAGRAIRHRCRCCDARRTAERERTHRRHHHQ
jgi:hypothetical protein